MARRAVTKKPVEPIDNEVGVITEEEMLGALSLPATFINTIYPLYRDGIVRLAFGESISQGTVFHTAIAMDLSIARLLQRALSEVLDDQPEDDG